MLDQAIISGASLLIGIAAARLVGIAEFGRFTLVLIFATFAQSIHNALIAAPMMTLAGARSQRSTQYYAGVLRGALALSAVVGLITFGILAAMFAARDGSVPMGLVLSAAALIIAQNMQFTVRRMLFAQGQGGQALVMDVLRHVLFALAIVALVLLGVSVDANAMLWALAATALVSVLPFGRPLFGTLVRRRILKPISGRHWNIARWLFPVELISFGQDQLVWIVAGVMLGDSALGGLRAAQYVVGIMLLIMASTENFLPTRAGRAFAQGGANALRSYVFGVALRLGAAVGSLLLIVAVPASFWLRTVFGEAFEPYAPLVHIFALSVAFIFVRDMAAQLFRAIQRTETIFHAYVASMIVSFTLAYPLLVGFGATGAALVVAAGHFTSMTYVLVSALRCETLRRTPRPRSRGNGTAVAS